MKQIAIFPSLDAAYIAKGMLESNGIACEVTENALNSVFPAPNAFNGGIALLCADNMAKNAEALLREHGDIE